MVGCSWRPVVVLESIINALILFSFRLFVRRAVMRSTNADVVLALLTIATHTLPSDFGCEGISSCQAGTETAARIRTMRNAKRRGRREHSPRPLSYFLGCCG